MKIRRKRLQGRNRRADAETKIKGFAQEKVLAQAPCPLGSKYQKNNGECDSPVDNASPGDEKMICGQNVDLKSIGSLEHLRAQGLVITRYGRGQVLSTRRVDQNVSSLFNFSETAAHSGGEMKEGENHTLNDQNERNKGNEEAHTTIFTVDLGYAIGYLPAREIELLNSKCLPDNRQLSSPSVSAPSGPSRANYPMEKDMTQESAHSSPPFHSSHPTMTDTESGLRQYTSLGDILRHRRFLVSRRDLYKRRQEIHVSTRVMAAVNPTCKVLSGASGENGPLCKVRDALTKIVSNLRKAQVTLDYRRILPRSDESKHKGMRNDDCKGERRKQERSEGVEGQYCDPRSDNLEAMGQGESSGAEGPFSDTYNRTSAYKKGLQRRFLIQLVLDMQSIPEYITSRRFKYALREWEAVKRALSSRDPLIDIPEEIYQEVERLRLLLLDSVEEAMIHGALTFRLEKELIQMFKALGEEERALTLFLDRRARQAEAANADVPSPRQGSGEKGYYKYWSALVRVALGAIPRALQEVREVFGTSLETMPVGKAETESKSYQKKRRHSGISFIGGGPYAMVWALQQVERVSELFQAKVLKSASSLSPIGVRACLREYIKAVKELEKKGLTLTPILKRSLVPQLEEYITGELFDKSTQHVARVILGEAVTRTSTFRVWDITSGTESMRLTRKRARRVGPDNSSSSVSKLGYPSSSGLSPGNLGSSLTTSPKSRPSRSRIIITPPQMNLGNPDIDIDRDQKLDLAGRGLPGHAAYGPQHHRAPQGMRIHLSKAYVMGSRSHDSKNSLLDATPSAPNPLAAFGVIETAKTPSPRQRFWWASGKGDVKKSKSSKSSGSSPEGQRKRTLMDTERKKWIDDEENSGRRRGSHHNSSAREIDKILNDSLMLACPWPSRELVAAHYHSFARPMQAGGLGSERKFGIRGGRRASHIRHQSQPFQHQNQHTGGGSRVIWNHEGQNTPFTAKGPEKPINKNLHVHNRIDSSALPPGKHLQGSKQIPDTQALVNEDHAHVRIILGKKAIVHSPVKITIIPSGKALYETLDLSLGEALLLTRDTRGLLGKRQGQLALYTHISNHVVEMVEGYVATMAERLLKASRDSRGGTSGTARGDEGLGSDREETVHASCSSGGSSTWAYVNKWAADFAREGNEWKGQNKKGNVKAKEKNYSGNPESHIIDETERRQREAKEYLCIFSSLYWVAFDLTSRIRQKLLEYNPLHRCAGDSVGGSEDGCGSGEGDYEATGTHGREQVSDPERHRGCRAGQAPGKRPMSPDYSFSSSSDARLRQSVGSTKLDQEVVVPESIERIQRLVRNLRTTLSRWLCEASLPLTPSSSAASIPTSAIPRHDLATASTSNFEGTELKTKVVASADAIGRNAVNSSTVDMNNTNSRDGNSAEKTRELDRNLDKKSLAKSCEAPSINVNAMNQKDLVSELTPVTPSKGRTGTRSHQAISVPPPTPASPPPQLHASDDLERGGPHYDNDDKNINDDNFMNDHDDDAKQSKGRTSEDSEPNSASHQLSNNWWADWLGFDAPKDNKSIAGAPKFKPNSNFNLGKDANSTPNPSVVSPAAATTSRSLGSNFASHGGGALTNPNENTKRPANDSSENRWRRSMTSSSPSSRSALLSRPSQPMHSKLTFMVTSGNELTPVPPDPPQRFHTATGRALSRMRADVAAQCETYLGSEQAQIISQLALASALRFIAQEAGTCAEHLSFLSTFLPSNSYKTDPAEEEAQPSAWVQDGTRSPSFVVPNITSSPLHPPDFKLRRGQPSYSHQHFNGSQKIPRLKPTYDQNGDSIRYTHGLSFAKLRNIVFDLNRLIVDAGGIAVGLGNNQRYAWKVEETAKEGEENLNRKSSTNACSDPPSISSFHSKYSPNSSSNVTPGVEEKRIPSTTWHSSRGHDMHHHSNPGYSGPDLSGLESLDTEARRLFAHLLTVVKHSDTDSNRENNRGGGTGRDPAGRRCTDASLLRNLFYLTGWIPPMQLNRGKRGN